MNNSESIGTTLFPEPVEKLLDFIEKEPVMKWLLCRVAQKHKDLNATETNQWPYLVLAAHEDGHWGPQIDACMYWTGEEWAICQHNGNESFIGTTLDIQKIISGVGLSGHEIMEAAEVYGTKGAAPNQYPMTDRTMIAEILSCCDLCRWPIRKE